MEVKMGAQASNPSTQEVEAGALPWANGKNHEVSINKVLLGLIWFGGSENESLSSSGCPVAHCRPGWLELQGCAAMSGTPENFVCITILGISCQADLENPAFQMLFLNVNFCWLCETLWLGFDMLWIAVFYWHTKFSALGETVETMFQLWRKKHIFHSPISRYQTDTQCKVFTVVCLYT